MKQSHKATEPQGHGARSTIETAGLVGIEFRDGGSSTQGCDCWGLVALALRASGCPVPLRPEGALAERENLFQLVGLAGAFEAGDVIEMQVGEERHVGIVVDGFRVLHTFRGGASRLDPLNWFMRYGRVVSVNRPRGF